jgi:hypothetical protein
MKTIMTKIYWDSGLLVRRGMEMYHCRSQNDRQVDERMQFTDLYTDNERKSRSVSAVKAKSRRLSVTGKHL